MENIFECGDIVLIHEKGLVARLIQILQHSHWNHVLLIDELLPWFSDYGIFESIGSKGVSCGLLSFYRGKEISVYRYKMITPEQQSKIKFSAIQFGRYRYDTFLPFRVIKLLGMRRAFKLLFKMLLNQSVDIPHCLDSYIVCSELVQEAYRKVDIELCNDNYLLLPRDIENSDYLINIWRGIY